MEPTRMRSIVQQASLVAAPLLALGLYLLLPEAYEDRQGQIVPLSHAARATVAVASWMAFWWITEAIPVYATALLPLALLPILGAGSIRQVAAPYGHELIFLFMGGFVIALAMQRWELDRRIALVALRWFGTEPRSVVGGCMLVTAALSMWVSNTATAVMMLPIAVSLIDRLRGADIETMDARGRNFAVCLLLGIAYAASIGGIGTLIGTPPNLFLASYIETQLALQISFVRWMGIGVPLVAVFLPLAWLLLTRVLYPLPASRPRAHSESAEDAHLRVGPVTRGERATLVVFSLTAGLWIFRPLLTQVAWGDARPLAGLSDAGIAILAALSLFVIPVDLRRRVFVMDWETAVRLPWGLLILFGGGLSLAAAIQANGVGEFLGSQVAGLAGLPSVILVLSVAALMIFLTELTSNTATTATLVPILGALAPALQVDPFLLIVPAAIAASCAFMLPVATPPNAVVFGSGLVSIPQMCRAGLWLNLLGIVLITGLTYAVALPLLTGRL
jgi:sodium-dependent dicarboxylate transporter 2/3/5